jgi:hypothetical protein
LNCPFCAEEIQDAAVICRFCGAAKSAAGEWGAPAPRSTPPAHRPGSTTIRSSGAFFLLSSLVSLVSITDDAPLFGAMRSGFVAVSYNLIFAVLFLAMGLALILGRSWGYRVFMAGTAIYSLDRLLFLLSKDTRDAYLTASGVTQQVRGMMDMSMIDEGVFLGTILTLICWWGFALYIYWRRDYFC